IQQPPDLTQMEGDWWRFWESGYGYHKRAWFQEYLAQRDGEVSKTRKCIEAIAAGLTGARVLEANIDARPSADKSTYPKPATKQFDYLLNACGPKVIIAHGTDACSHLQSWKGKGTLIECRHFIYVGRTR